VIYEMMLDNGQWVPMEDPIPDGDLSWEESMKEAGYSVLSRVGDASAYTVVVRKGSSPDKPAFLVEAVFGIDSQLYVGAATMGDMYKLLNDLTQLTYNSMRIDDETAKH
jgi:hypothetical protein